MSVLEGSHAFLGVAKLLEHTSADIGMRVQEMIVQKNVLLGMIGIAK